jgi:hypothetical protein
MKTAPAIRLRPLILRQNIAGFLDFVQGVYELGGWRGSIRFDLQLVSPDAFPAVDEGTLINFLRLSETATLRATAQFEYESLETHRDDLVEEIMRRVAYHFGLDEFHVNT